MPDALHDPNNPRQPWASSAVKETLVEFACRDEYSSDVMFGISAANPEAAQALSSVYLEATPEELDEDNPYNTCDDSDVHADLDERRRLKKVTQAELSLCLKARMANQALLPFLTVCMTLMCYKTGMSDDAWGTLCAMGLVYNRCWVGDFCTLVSARLVAAGFLPKMGRWVPLIPCLCLKSKGMTRTLTCRVRRTWRGSSMLPCICARPSAFSDITTRASRALRRRWHHGSVTAASRQRHRFLHELHPQR